MFGKILVAYDGSASGAAAVSQAAELALLCKAELHLLGIVATGGFMALAEGTASLDIWGMEREKLEQAQDAAVRDLESRGVKVIASIREGDPEQEIANYARETNVDLVVIGHSGKGVVGRWLTGSVGADLLKNLPCSVLISPCKS